MLKCQFILFFKNHSFLLVVNLAYLNPASPRVKSMNLTRKNLLQVYNVIPSISAITGISPQRYLWRICVALHIGPRIVIAFVYNTYYLSRLPTIPKDDQAKYRRLLSICYWLNVIEISSLLGVTYVSNRENYRECGF